MTKEEFKDLQLDLQQSGMSITKYLQHVGINYNTYHYWRKKLKESESPKRAIKGFVFGSRMAEEDIDFIMKTFSGRDLEYSKIELRDISYELSLKILKDRYPSQLLVL